MVLPALEVDLVEGMRPDGRSCLVRVGRGSNLGAEQTTFRECLLSFARPQRCIRSRRELFAQARRLVEAKQALTDVVDAGC